jgi:hypothetical protein
MVGLGAPAAGGVSEVGACGAAPPADGSVCGGRSRAEASSCGWPPSTMQSGSTQVAGQSGWEAGDGFPAPSGGAGRS